VAVVDMGKTRLSLSVFYNNNMIYTREQEFGGKQLTLEIQRRYGLSEAEALFAQKEGGLPDDYEQEILKPFKETVLQQLARSLQLFYASTEYHTVDSILLGGELSHVPGLSALIEKQLEVPLRVANPFTRMSIAPHVSVPMLNADAPSLLVCCGLALRSFE
jgi:type IV pilus assembly protein PilM